MQGDLGAVTVVPGVPMRTPPPVSDRPPPGIFRMTLELVSGDYGAFTCRFCSLKPGPRGVRVGSVIGGFQAQRPEARIG
jgi:hypothetical protein